VDLYAYNTYTPLHGEEKFIYIYRSQNNVVGIVIKLRARKLRNRGLIVGMGRKFLSSPKGPNRLGAPSSLRLNDYRRLFHRE
jgi:hypothetical protein